MRRRELITLLGGAAVAWPPPARAQQPTMLRIGVVSLQPRTTPSYLAFVRRLAELGYHEGSNFTLDLVQIASIDAYEHGFREFSDRKPDILLASGPESSLKAALTVAGALPIVMIAVDYDPVVRGYVSSLARPSGRITGISFQQVELSLKRLELFREAFPNVKAATVFWDQVSGDQWQAVKAAAPALGLRLAGIEFRRQPYDYEQALVEAPVDHRGALIVLSSPAFAVPNRARIPEFALRRQIPSTFFIREFVQVGGLMSYGASITDLYRRAADYVDRIAKGAKPSDLPIEQPTKFELAVNLKTAKAIGVTLPTSILLRADEVIE